MSSDSTDPDFTLYGTTNWISTISFICNRWQTFCSNNISTNFSPLNYSLFKLQHFKMKLLPKLRHPLVLFFGLILVLGLAQQGDGFGLSAVFSIFSKVMKVATKAAGGLAGHTWNVVSFKLVETGWNGLLNAIFPKEDKVTDTMNEILDRFDQVEDLVRS
jgi:hypothetical protein